MSDKQPAPVFLAKDAYRKRRLRDFARAAPVIGTVLLMIPLIWGPSTATSNAIVYIFGVWVLLIGLAAFVSGRLRDVDSNKAHR